MCCASSSATIIGMFSNLSHLERLLRQIQNRLLVFVGWQMLALQKHQHEQLSELNKIAEEKAEEAAEQKKAAEMLAALKNKSVELSERCD